MSATLKIENKTFQRIRVKVTENVDWTLADVAGSFVKSLAVAAASGGAGAPLVMSAGTVTAIKAMNTVKDLYSVYSKVEKYYRVLDALQRRGREGPLNALREAMHKGAIEVGPGETKVVHIKHRLPFEGIEPLIPQGFRDAVAGKNGDNLAEAILYFAACQIADDIDSKAATIQMVKNTWDRLSPSVIASYFSGASDSTVYITSGDFHRTAYFNANSDDHWIVAEDNNGLDGTYWSYLKRARDHGIAAYYTNSVGSSLAAGEFLEAWDSLDVQTRNFDPQKIELPNTSTGNKAADIGIDSVIGFIPGIGPQLSMAKQAYDGVFRPVANAAVSAIASIGSSHAKLLYDSRGNLRNVQGIQDVWSSGITRRPAWRTYMQEDGNLVAYSEKGKPSWALWKDMPLGYGGSSVKLDPNADGRLYYCHPSDPSKCFFVDQHQSHNFY